MIADCREGEIRPNEETRKYGNLNVLFERNWTLKRAGCTHRAGGETVVESICMCNQGAGPRGGQFLGVF